jgi:hypothetical protein
LRTRGTPASSHCGPPGAHTGLASQTTSRGPHRLARPPARPAAAAAAARWPQRRQRAPRQLQRRDGGSAYQGYSFGSGRQLYGVITRVMPTVQRQLCKGRPRACGGRGTFEMWCWAGIRAHMTTGIWLGAVRRSTGSWARTGRGSPGGTTEGAALFTRVHARNRGQGQCALVSAPLLLLPSVRPATAAAPLLLLLLVPAAARGQRQRPPPASARAAAAAAARQARVCGRAPLGVKGGGVLDAPEPVLCPELPFLIALARHDALLESSRGVPWREAWGHIGYEVGIEGTPRMGARCVPTACRPQARMLPAPSCLPAPSRRPPALSPGSRLPPPLLTLSPMPRAIVQRWPERSST